MTVSIFGINLGFSLPTISSQGIGFWLLMIALFVLFTVIISVVVWMWYMNKIYNKKIIIFENIAGKGYQNTGSDKARVVKVGDQGEEILFLRKRKVYRSSYGRKMGTNTFWFAIGQDGYWYNILLGDLDAKMGMLDIEPIDRDMRYMHVAIRKNIQERYRKQSVMEKYGPIIISGLFLIIMLVGIWINLSKIGDVAHEQTVSIDAYKELAEQFKTIAANMDKFCAGGSGISPVG